MKGLDLKNIVRVMPDGTRRPATEEDRVERLAELRVLLRSPGTTIEDAKAACRELYRWGSRIDADEAWKEWVDHDPDLY